MQIQKEDLGEKEVLGIEEELGKEEELRSSSAAVRIDRRCSSRQCIYHRLSAIHVIHSNILYTHCVSGILIYRE